MTPVVRVFPSSGPYPSQGALKYATTPGSMSAAFTTGQRQILFEIALLVRYLPSSKILKYHTGVTPGQVPVLRGGKNSWLSPAYMWKPSPICLLLLQQAMALALSLALANAGRSIAARIAMMAITTSNSISVKPPEIGLCRVFMQCQSVSTDVARRTPPHSLQ